MANMTDIHAVGKRKAAVARVYLFSGKPKGFVINKIPLEDYLSDHKDRIEEVLAPFKVTGVDNNYLIKVNVFGGGKSGQIGAIRLGISRALAQLDEKTRKTLRTNGFLTRDSRVVERKKFGRHKARKSTQFSKR